MYMYISSMHVCHMYMHVYHMYMHVYHMYMHVYHMYMHVYHMYMHVYHMYMHVLYMHVTGSKAALLFPSRLGDHTLSLEYDCRHLHSFAHSVPMVIREEAGHSMKCSIKVEKWPIDSSKEPLIVCTL